MLQYSERESNNGHLEDSEMEQQYTQEILNMPEDGLHIDKVLEDKLLSGGDEAKIPKQTKNPNPVEQTDEDKFEKNIYEFLLNDCFINKNLFRCAN